MNQLVQISALVGAALPLLVAVLNRVQWQARTKAVVAFAASAVAAVLAAVVSGDLTLANYGTALPVVFAAAHVTYAGLWKPTQIAPKIEVATTPGTHLPEDVPSGAEWAALHR